MQGEIIAISRKEAINFLLPRHYSGRVPSITYAYGWYIDRKLKAVVTYGKPASPFLCKGICGEKWADRVYELNRLCREEDFTLPLSHFVAETLKRLKCLDWIVVSYSDTAMHHNGYIYQACNFLYTGQTKERTDIYAGEGKHSRHYDQEQRANNIRLLRSSKNRYVYFCTGKKALKAQWKRDLLYPIQPYPKAENRNYVLGEYIKPTLIDKRTGKIVGWERVEGESVSDWLDRLLA